MEPNGEGIFGIRLKLFRPGPTGFPVGEERSSTEVMVKIGEATRVIIANKHNVKGIANFSRNGVDEMSFPGPYCPADIAVFTVIVSFNSGNKIELAGTRSLSELAKGHGEGKSHDVLVNVKEESGLITGTVQLTAEFRPEQSKIVPEPPQVPHVPQVLQVPQVPVPMPEGKRGEEEGQDIVEWAVCKLKGVRPELLRTGTYYHGAKQVYASLAGLPVLNAIAPTVESVAESLVSMAPLMPSTEGDEKSVVALDKKISDTLAYVDETVDTKKDNVLEGVVELKNAVKGFETVQSALEMAGDVGTGVGNVYESAHDTVECTMKSVTNAVDSVYGSVVGAVGDTVNQVSAVTGGSVESTINIASAKASNTVSSVRSTASGALGATSEAADGVFSAVKAMIGCTVGTMNDAVGSSASGAFSLASIVFSIPMRVVSSLLGGNRNDPGSNEE